MNFSLYIPTPAPGSPVYDTPIVETLAKGFAVVFGHDELYWVARISNFLDSAVNILLDFSSYVRTDYGEKRYYIISIVIFFIGILFVVIQAANLDWLEKNLLKHFTKSQVDMIIWLLYVMPISSFWTISFTLPFTVIPAFMVSVLISLVVWDLLGIPVSKKMSYEEFRKYFEKDYAEAGLDITSEKALWDNKSDDIDDIKTHYFPIYIWIVYIPMIVRAIEYVVLEI